MQVMRMMAVVMFVVAVATTGYAQSGAMAPEQMKMMSDQMKTMSDQMKGGKMAPDQMKVMGEHMQMMADRMKDGQMTPDQMKTMSEHKKGKKTEKMYPRPRDTLGGGPWMGVAFSPGGGPRACILHERHQRSR